MPWPEPKFRITRSRGYDPQDVDALIDQLEDAERNGRPIPADLVLNATFNTAHLSGYRMDDVDTWLDQVVTSLAQAGTPTGAAEMPTTPPVGQITQNTSWRPPRSEPTAVPDVDRTSDLTAATTSASMSKESPRWPLLTGIAVAVVVIILIFYFAF